MGHIKVITFALPHCSYKSKCINSILSIFWSLKGFYHIGAVLEWLLDKAYDLIYWACQEDYICIQE